MNHRGRPHGHHDAGSVAGRDPAGAYGRLHGLTWVVPVIGTWTIIAPWVMAGAVDTTRTIWSNAVAGAAVVAFGLVMTVFGVIRARRSLN